MINGSAKVQKISIHKTIHQKGTKKQKLAILLRITANSPIGTTPVPIFPAYNNV